MEDQSIIPETDPAVNAGTPSLPIDVIEFLLAYARMRKLQKRFFRGERTKNLVGRAKALEQLSDRLHAELLIHHPDIKAVVDATADLEGLFAEGDAG